MNKESDNTKEEVELSQLVGAIIRDVAKARVQADQYSHLLSEKYKEKEDNGEQLVSFPVPRAEISDVEVKFKFAVSEIKEAPDSTETKIFFFNKVLEKHTNLLTNEYFSVAQKILILSPKDLLFYRESIRKSIIDWLETNFECELKNKEIVITEHTDSKQDIIKDRLIEMLTLELIKIIENKHQIFIEQQLNQAEQKYSQAKI